MNCKKCGCYNDFIWFEAVKPPPVYSPAEIEASAAKMPTIYKRWACQACAQYHFADGSLYSDPFAAEDAQPIRSQAQIDAATVRAAKVRAAYMVDRLRDDLPDFANLRRGDLAKTGGVSLWQVVFVAALIALGTYLVIWFDPFGIVWMDG